MDKEKERELRKLLNVLRRMARTARMYQWTGTKEEADSYSIEQYNRILRRLAALDRTAEELFAALPTDATWSTLSNACRDLAAYYEDDAAGDSEPAEKAADSEKSEAPRGPRREWSGPWGDPSWFDRNAFKHNMPQEMQELGQFIREKIAEWQERKRTEQQPPRK